MQSPLHLFPCVLFYSQKAYKNIYTFRSAVDAWLCVVRLKSFMSLFFCVVLRDGLLLSECFIVSFLYSDGNG